MFLWDCPKIVVLPILNRSSIKTLFKNTLLISTHILCFYAIFSPTFLPFRIKFPLCYQLLYLELEFTQWNLFAYPFVNIGNRARLVNPQVFHDKLT